MTRRLVPFLLTFALLPGCGRDAAPSGAASATPPTTAAARYAREDWTLPVTASAAQPDLVRAPDGSLLLSWIEPQEGAHALKFARFADGAWSGVHEVARGDDWFVNWADTPHIAQTPDGALWAHWLRKSANAKYAYDVALVRSGDGGATWSKPVLVNDDGTPTEHGFVSLWPAARDRIGIAWLDGRNSGGGGHGSHAAHGQSHAGTPPAMTLRGATFDASLQRHDERQLDAMTCDCCQTDAALTARGPLLVYRGRTPDEIRDVLTTRFEGGAWSASVPVHVDNWKMPACPVNGPAIGARADEAVVGWYTETEEASSNGLPTVKLARSADGGAHFAEPIELDRRPDVAGRIDVALGDDAVWAIWAREDAGGQSLWFARLAPDLSRELQRGELVRLQGRGRGTGFAKIAFADGTAHVVWTDVVDQRPRLLGARLRAVP